MPITDPEKRRKYMNNYFSKWREDNRDDYNAYHRDWCRKNPDNVKAIKRRYEQNLRKMGTG